ncbi:MAG: hypothetical protein JSR39_05635 [Verrucomicrobia bacterium]|nr:hypothetical protein [Verrucomicrobiota bacterium]
MHSLLLCSCLFLSVILASCRSSSPWALDRVESGNSDFNSAKLTFPANDPIHGIDVEFLNTSKNLYVYLNVHSIPIPALKNNPKYAFVHLTIGTEKYRFEALRREGGQRLLLPEEAVDLMISSLRKNLPIEIKVSGYSTQITPSGFPEKFKKMQQSPLFPNPFHLPF